MSNLNPEIQTKALSGLVNHGNFVAVTFFIVMLAGLIQIIQAFTSLDWRNIPLSENEFRTGKTAATLERQLDQKMPLRNTLIGLANGVRYGITGGSVDQVRVGQSGWLFLTEEIRFDADGLSNMSARMDLLAGTRLALQTKGVNLLVAIVPDKARIYADQLRGAGYPIANQNRYSEALQQLARRDVPTVDLLQPMLKGRNDREIYYRTDTHWNQSGAALAASSVSIAARKLSSDLGNAQFVTQQDVQVSQRDGDLIRLMGLDSMPAAMRPKADQEAVARTTPVNSTSSNALLGDAYVPVVLVGTSYSLRGNFHGYLQQNLGAPVLNTAMDGGGFLQAMSDYLKNDAFLQAKPKVLVWEIPERFLSMPLTEERDWLKKMGLYL